MFEATFKESLSRSMSTNGLFLEHCSKMSKAGGLSFVQ